MNALKIKICGITQTDNMLEISALLPDYMGFIFFKNSPRDVSDRIHELSLKELPACIKKVAVLVNKPLEEAKEIILKYGFDKVQLHGDESPDYCISLQKIVPVIKAFGITDKLPDEPTYYENCCDYFLFDKKGKNAGGTGITFDHDILKDYTMTKPFFLAGGIGPEHAPDGTLENVLSHPSIFALDINSRFETTPGIKDVGLIKKFLVNIRRETEAEGNSPKSQEPRAIREPENGKRKTTNTLR